MKTVPLGGKKAAGRVALVDDEDYDLVMQYRWHVHEQRNTEGVTTSGPYAVTTIPIPPGDMQAKRWPCGKVAQRRVLMHQLIAGYKGPDHSNGNGLDNRRANLRPATVTQNSANQRPRRGTSSRYKGVRWCKKSRKWRAGIKVNGRERHLGLFTSEEDAARAYNEAALGAWGEYAYLNQTQGPAAATRDEGAA